MPKQLPSPIKLDGTNLKIEVIDVALLKEDPRNPRDHSDEHVAEIGRSISAFGMNVPILHDENYVIVAGTATCRAVRKLGLTKVPAVMLSHLSAAEKVAFRIAHNRMSEKGQWDPVILAENFEYLADAQIEFDLGATGFEIPEIDVLMLGGRDAITAAAAAAAEEPEIAELSEAEENPVSRLHDRFTIGGNIVVCGDATKPDPYRAALGTTKADLALSDGPYNIPTAQISGRGRTKHSDFVQGSGELSSDDYQIFICNAARQMSMFCRAGAYILLFTAWYSLLDMVLGANRVFGKLVHICIWTKTNGGMGFPWRNAWEGILVFRNKGGRVQNNIQLGKFGRNRSDVFRHAGVNVFREGRMEELTAHPTCKPIGLLKDLIIDLTPIGGTVLDSFLGSGSTIIAAHEAKRRGVGIELDPRYVDVAIKRIEKAIGETAIHESGLTFAELGEARRKEKCNGTIVSSQG